MNVDEKTLTGPGKRGCGRTAEDSGTPAHDFYQKTFESRPEGVCERAVSLEQSKAIYFDRT
jgi:hypothetical protein